MKRNLSICLVLMLLTSIVYFSSSCTKAPLSTTCVSFNGDSAIRGITFRFTSDTEATTIVGQTIIFSNCTPGATSYLWNFGDGTTATTASVSHKYTLEGIYTVTFTPSNSSGPGRTKTFIITVDYLGTWTFKGITYNVTYLIGSLFSGTVTLTNDTSRYSTNCSEMGLGFLQEPVTKVYAISTFNAGISDSNHVNVYFSTLAANGLFYSPTGGNGNDQFLTVTLTGNKIHYSATGIEMKNQPWDSAKLDFDFYQRRP